MRNRILTTTTFLLVLLLLLFPASASAAPFLFPPTPDLYWGSVQVNGHNVPTGTVISAWAGGVPYVSWTTTAISGSNYSLTVPGDDPQEPGLQGALIGETIYFHIGELVANQTSTWVSGGNHQNYALTFTTDTYVDDDFTAATPGFGLFRFALIDEGYDAANIGLTAHVAEGSYETAFIDHSWALTVDGNISIDGGLIITSGTFNAPLGTLSLGANFELYSPGVFNHRNGTVAFTSSGGTQIITGSPAFYNVQLADDVFLRTTSSDDIVTVSGLRSYAPGSHVRESRSISGTGPYSFGLSQVDLNLISSGLTSLQVDRYQATPAHATSAMTEGRYWDFVPSGTGYTLDLTLPHTPGMSEPKACRWVNGPGAGWDCAYNSFTGTTVTRSGIVAPDIGGIWTVGEQLNPTSLTLLSLDARPANSPWLLVLLAGASILALAGLLVLTRWKLHRQRAS